VGRRWRQSRRMRSDRQRDVPEDSRVLDDEQALDEMTGGESGVRRIRGRRCRRTGRGGSDDQTERRAHERKRQPSLRHRRSPHPLRG